MTVSLKRAVSSTSVRSAARGVIGRFNGTLGPRNLSDDYTLTVSRRATFSASLTGLQSNAALQLRTRDGRLIALSNRVGRRSELIRQRLAPGRYTVRVLRINGRTPYSLVVSDNSSVPTPPPPIPTPPPPIPTPPPPPPGNPFRDLWGTYRGTGTTTIGILNPFSGQFSSVNSFQTNIIAEVTAPRTAGGIVESNPFSLFVGSSPAEIAANAQGAISVNSAIPFNLRDGFLLQYWNLQYSGNQLSGTLVNPDSGTALTTNLFNSTQDLGVGLSIPFPYQMAVGTTLQGTLTPTELRLRIQGADTGQTRAFVTDLVVQRVPGTNRAQLVASRRSLTATAALFR